MAFHVTNLSDICSTSGDKLNPIFMSPTPYPVQRNRYEQLIKHHITRFNLSKWRNLIRSIFTGNQISLPAPLGPWRKMDYDTWVNTWDFFITLDK